MTSSDARMFPSTDAACCLKFARYDTRSCEGRDNKLIERPLHGPPSMLAVRLIAYSEKARDRLPLSRGEHSSQVSTPTMFIKELGAYVSLTRDWSSAPPSASSARCEKHPELPLSRAIPHRVKCSG